MPLIHYIPGVDIVAIELKTKYRIELPHDRIMFGLDYENKGTYVQYPGFLFIDEGYEEYLNEVFRELKDMVS